MDTGSAGTILNANRLEAIGVIPEENDVVDAIRGIGGVEYVYTKVFDFVELEHSTLNQFQVEQEGLYEHANLLLQSFVISDTLAEPDVSIMAIIKALECGRSTSSHVLKRRSSGVMRC